MAFVGLGTAVVGGVLAGGGAMASGAASARQSESAYKHRYQWTVKDLRKAGLNPMLAYSQGAPPPSIPAQPNAGEAAVEGGTSAYGAAMQGKVQREQLELLRAQRGKTIQEGRAVELNNLITESSPLYQSAKSTLGEFGEVRGPSAAASQRWDAELSKITAEATQLAQSTEVQRLQAELQKGELTLQEVKIKYADELATIERDYRRAMATAAEAGVPAAIADAEFWANAGSLGKLAAFLKALLK